MDNPDRAERLTAALGHLEARHWRLAEVQCRLILAHDPKDIEAALVLGLAVAATGEATRAAPFLERVRCARPDHADPCRDLATMRPRVPRSVVLRQYRACLRLTPGNMRLRHDFAAYLLENDSPDAVPALLREAPDCATTFNLRGLALAELGRFREAARCFEAAVADDPASHDNWANLGQMLRIEGRFDESLAAYDEALAHNPCEPRLKVSRAMTLLQAGRWREGWTDYEAPLDRPGRNPPSVAPKPPRLGPAARLDGSRILVWHDEGFGETLQFARYLPLLADRGARVIALVPPSLTRLLSGMTGIEVARTGDPAVPPHDAQIPFRGLPGAFGATPDTIPPAPYLTADPTLTETWRERLNREGAWLLAGLVWSGLARPWLHGFAAVDRRRSTTLAALAPFASLRGARFVSLQAGTAAAQAQDPPLDMRIFDPMETVGDFAETAAIIANLDVVVSVDTAVAHLAGAMGKPVFLLDRYDTCWRWLHGRTDTPWYPSMTICRQTRPGDWGSSVHRALTGLSAMGRRAVPPHLPQAA